MITEITTYLETLSNGSFSEHTIRGYRKDLQKLSDYFNIQNVSDFEKISVADFHRFYVSCNLKPASLKSLIQNLSPFFNWCLSNELIKTCNFSKVTFGNNKRFPKVVRESKFILSQKQTEDLIKAGSNIQEKFMIALMSYTAIRRGEVCKIKLQDIKGCEITIHGKGEKIRKVFLDEILCTMLNIFTAQRESDSEYLFYGERGEKTDDGSITEQTVYNRIKNAGAKAGFSAEDLKKLTPHRLRGTGITRLVILYGLDVAQRVAGHSSPLITKIYDESGDALVRMALLGQRSKMETMQQ